MAQKEITLVQINDTHAYLDLHTELVWTGSGADVILAGGYARIASALASIRASRPDRVLAFDGGDTFHGTHPAVDTRGEALLPILNALRLDGMTGHWDFAYGPERLRELVGRMNFPFLANNCYEKDTDRLAFPDAALIDRGGLTVGAAGIAATIVDKTMPPHFSEGLYFTLGRDELPETIRRLRADDAGLVVVVSHLGFPQDLQLAADVPGINVLLSAHTHNRLVRPARVGDTLIIQSGSHGSFIGVLDLVLEDGAVVDYRHQLLPITPEIQPDPAVQALVDEALAPYRDEYEQVLGQTRTLLDRNTALEATMDNFLLQGLLAHTGDELAFSNGWRYGAPVPPGPVTRADLWNIIPTNPPVSRCRMSGSDLREMLEENLEHTYARDPYRQMGGYVKRALGLRMYVKIENPRGERIQDLYVNDQPLDPDRLYNVTYVTKQGVPAKYGQDHQDLDLRAVPALERYLQKEGTVRSDLRGTVVVV